jgi:DNA mismatch repair protein MutS
VVHGLRTGSATTLLQFVRDPLFRIIVFLYAVEPGPANQSYGIQVARLAGIPKPVIDAARAKLNELESGVVNVSAISAPDQISLFPAAQPSAALDYLDTLDPNEITPRDALETLYRLHTLRSAERRKR